MLGVWTCGLLGFEALRKSIYCVIQISLPLQMIAFVLSFYVLLVSFTYDGKKWKCFVLLLVWFWASLKAGIAHQTYMQSNKTCMLQDKKMHVVAYLHCLFASLNPNHILNEKKEEQAKEKENKINSTSSSLLGSQPHVLEPTIFNICSQQHTQVQFVETHTKK